MRGLAAGLAVVLLGSLAIWQGTDGLRAFTAEAARRLAVERAPRSLPDPVLEDQDGRLFRLSDYRGRPVLVQFFFTRCPALCLVQSEGFAELAARWSRPGADPGAVLLSLSFDPAHDAPDKLSNYGARFDTDGAAWRLARVADPADLRSVLEAFGVVVIPDPLFGFQHNAATHLIDPAGRLAGIFDSAAPAGALRRLAP